MTITNNPKKTILITGSAGSFAKLLIIKLLKDDEYNIISVDKRPLSMKNLEHHQIDLRRKSAIELLRQKKPRIIIHLGVMRNPQKHRQKRQNVYFFNLETASQILKLAQAVNCEKLIFLSSANMYGPSADTCGFLNEDALLHAASKNPEFRDLVAIDMMMQSFFWKQSSTKTIILRPCHIVGPHLNNAPSRYFRLENIPYLLGFDPIMQLIHEHDLIEAIMKCIKTDHFGIFNLAGPDTAPLSFIINALGKKSIALPQTLLKAFMATTFFSKQSSFPVSELEHLKYSCLVDTTRAKKELNFMPKYGIHKIINAIKNQPVLE
jgi:UDP-glucose 4-epimerase